jgi:hypothetical protein
MFVFMVASSARHLSAGWAEALDAEPIARQIDDQCQI